MLALRRELLFCTYVNRYMHSRFVDFGVNLYSQQRSSNLERARSGEHAASSGAASSKRQPTHLDPGQANPG